MDVLEPINNGLEGKKGRGYSVASVYVIVVLMCNADILLCSVYYLLRFFLLSIHFFPSTLLYAYIYIRMESIQRVQSLELLMVAFEPEGGGEGIGGTRQGV